MTSLSPPTIDSPAMRSADRELLALALMDARNHTLQLLGRFEPVQAKGAQEPASDSQAQAPAPVWVVGHAAWLAEWWIARNPRRGEGGASPGDGLRLPSSLPLADACFDPRSVRAAEAGSVALPASGALREWLLQTVEGTLDLLEKTEPTDRALHLFRAMLFHEDAVGEQLVTAAQTLGIRLALPPPAAQAPREPLWLPAVRWSLGSDGPGFAFDLERPAHVEAVPEFEIDAQPVSWAQFVEFVDDGGYDRPELWHPEGWDWARREGRRAPRHVDQIGVASGAVLQSWFGRPTRMAGAQPAVHISWWEADAWARWAGRRLPTEVEWEVAAHTAGSRGFRWGEVHEWTAGLLRPWDGYTPEAWTEHTLFDPRDVWGQARVRRGASLATRARMKHPKARGFALPASDEAFVGFRTCAP
jgi:gamma-glutamyl hercynylcysteine S-oxide synthase